MINASKEFKEKLKTDRPPLANYADITLSDGTVLHLEPKDFMIGGCSIEDKTSDGKFGVGFCIGKTLSIRLENQDERFSVYDFYMSTITLYVAMILGDGTIEKIRKGVYYATVPSTTGDTIQINAVDGMYMLDRGYSGASTTYPATLQKIISNACIDCGIPVGFRQFDNMDFVVHEKPENATYRQVVSWACQIAGYNARIDNDGYMQLIWYNTSILERYNYNGGSFNAYPHDEILDGGDFINYGAEIVVDGGKFEDPIPEHIFLIKSINVHTDDVVITGVRVSGKEDFTALFGEDGYVIEINGNPFTTGKEQAIADYLGGRMVGVLFRPFSAQVLSNPLYEPFDVVRVSDRKGNVYNSLLNSVSYKIGGYTQIACQAEDPVRNGSHYMSPAASAVVEARRNAEKQITEYDKAVQQLNQIAMNSMGFHTTYEEQQDGSRIVYLHDKPSLEDSKTIYKQTIDGFFVSTDGGNSYTAGFDKNGNAVVNVLYAIGIVADWIRSGRFECKKGDKTTFLADVDTGEVRIIADSFSLTSGQTIDSIAQSKADSAVNDFVTAVYDPKIASLQSQIDGQIETWYYDYEPTLSNAPASSWKTEADRARHEGDLFYWKSKGYSYRFFKDSSTWKWQIITDSDITKALADASKAQDTADNKRRVFVITPAPPYDVGDLWFAGSGSDIMTCMTARASGSYVASDWQKRNKYIDQTAANTAAQNAVDGQTQLDIFNKLTNNGQTQGIFLENGKIYINGEYIKVSDLYALGATIAGWTINSTQIYKVINLYEDMSANGLSGVGSEDPVQYYVWIRSPVDKSTRVFAVHYIKKRDYLSGLGVLYPIFYVNASGTFYAKNAEISGTIYASSGTFAGTLQAASGTFKGALQAATGTFSGGITSNSAEITGGSFKVSTSSSEASSIEIKYGNDVSYISPNFLKLSKSNYVSYYRANKIAMSYDSGSSEQMFFEATRTNLYTSGSFASGGQKNRVCKTENYSDRLLYCYETPKPYFGDIGEATLDENGMCYIFFDDIFRETVNTECNYQVFLQKYGEGDAWVSERSIEYFVVKGTPNLQFGWEIKARQIGYESERLEKFVLDKEDKQTNYESEAQAYIENIYKEAFNYEENYEHYNSDDSGGEADQRDVL